MPLSNKERQKRWRKKNRVIYNLRRRNKRKFKKIVEVTPDRPNLPEQPKTKVGELRALIELESSKPAEIAVPLPQKRYDDFGRQITEGQWKQLQERKSKAKSAGYVIDEFSQ